jgi:hypothetical protein
MFGGLGKQLGGFNPPNPPGNSNTGRCRTSAATLFIAISNKSLKVVMPKSMMVISGVKGIPLINDKELHMQSPAEMNR